MQDRTTVTRRTTGGAGGTAGAEGARDATGATAPSRGVQQLLHPVVLGSIIGSAGASAFVHVNRGLLPGYGPTVALVAWAVALAVVVWVVLLRPRTLPRTPAPAPRAGLVYVAAVVGMLVLMSLGRLALAALGHEDLQPAVVVLAVGLHFVPFARAFRAPVFGTLGLVVAALGVLGLVAGLVAGAVLAAAAAVLTGLVMLAVIALDQLRAAPTAA